MTLNATGRRLLGRSLGGVHIVIRSSAIAFGSKQAFPAHTRIKIHPVKRFLEPNDGMFNYDSAIPLAAARRFLSFLATHLSDVKQIHCIGNTDSGGNATSNYELGYARARAVCSILRGTTQLHHSTFTISSFGETRPRATNTTVRGRALNRRVDIIVTFKASGRIAR
jgi:outer membrane protein OmpA-like peptidoglycan-associated protein